MGIVEKCEFTSQKSLVIPYDAVLITVFLQDIVVQKPFDGQIIYRTIGTEKIVNRKNEKNLKKVVFLFLDSLYIIEGLIEIKKIKRQD